MHNEVVWVSKVKPPKRRELQVQHEKNRFKFGSAHVLEESSNSVFAAQSFLYFVEMKVSVANCSNSSHSVMKGTKRLVKVLTLRELAHPTPARASNLFPI